MSVMHWLIGILLSAPLASRASRATLRASCYPANVSLPSLWGNAWRMARDCGAFSHNGGFRINRDFRGDNRPRETRINERVRAREVRLIDEEGQMIGVMTSAQALALARERNLDLVEV